MAQRAKPARPAYRTTAGWKGPVNRGTVSRPVPLPKWAPTKDPALGFRRVNNAQTIA